MQISNISQFLLSFLKQIGLLLSVLLLQFFKKRSFRNIFQILSFSFFYVLLSVFHPLLYLFHIFINLLFFLCLFLRLPFGLLILFFFLLVLLALPLMLFLLLQLTLFLFDSLMKLFIFLYELIWTRKRTASWRLLIVNSTCRSKVVLFD